MSNPFVVCVLEDEFSFKGFNYDLLYTGVGKVNSLFYFLIGKNIFKTLVFFIFIQSVWAQNDPNPLRFLNNPIGDLVSIDLFSLWDKKNKSIDNSIVFVGSSSIRKWHTSKSFPELPVINRGFGGSHLSDINYFLHETVLKYHPKLVILYAGDNDIFYGKSPSIVFEDFIDFATNIHSKLPKTKIIYISIKPSPNRWNFWEKMNQTNTLIYKYTMQHSYLYYADTATSMLNDKGFPKSLFFISDSLHLSEEGYRNWDHVLLPVMNEALGLD